MTERQVYIHATHYDGADHWRHPAWLVSHTPKLVITRAAVGLVVQRDQGTWVAPWHTRGHYWPDRWYNVIRLDEADGRLSGFYCNVATPASFDGETLRYVDLQLDVRAYAEPDSSYRIELLDEDEFAEARERYAYPDDLVERAWAAVEELRRLIEARAFPFDLKGPSREYPR